MAHAHSDHDHRQHSGLALTRAARTVLEAAGEQWTDMRAAVFAALAEAPRPASAYDIADAVGRARGRRVAANSVYRILDLFVVRNLAQKIETANAFVANSHPGCRHDCMFMVCDTCGMVAHLDDAALTDGVRGAAGAAGFAVNRPVIEVRGLCGACQAAA